MQNWARLNTEQNSSSNIAPKKIQDHRIGLSYSEKSSRYVRLDQKIKGQYKYHREENIMNSAHADIYIQACDHAFDLYSKIFSQRRNLFQKENQLIDSPFLILQHKGTYHMVI